MIIYTIPLILTGMLQLLYNAADVIVVGRFAGSDSLAAVGSTSSLINLCTKLFIGLSSGTAVTITHYIGSNDSKSVQNSVHTSIFIALAGGILLTLIGMPLSRILLTLINTPLNILDEATLYIRIIFIGMPASLLYNFGSAILCSSGDTKTPFIILSISGILNIILNLIFVVGFKMGAAGVGLATIISQITSAVFISTFLMRLNNDCKLHFKKIRIHKYIFIKIVKIGIPAGVQGIISSLANTIIQSSINGFGSNAIAGSSAAASILDFCYVAMYSMHQSVITFVGQNIGAGKYERLKKIISTACIQVTCIGILVGAFILIFAHSLLNLYAPGDEEVIKMGMIRLSYIVPFYFICGIMDTLAGASRGMGAALMPMLASVAGACGTKILWIYTIFRKFKTLEILFIAYPVSWVVTAVIQFIFLVIMLKNIFSKNHIQKIQNSQQF